jgi:hypothetical protein
MTRTKEGSQVSIPNSKLAIWVLIGVVFWFVAAMMIRLMGTTVLDPKSINMVVLFVLSFPFGFASMRLIGSIVGLHGAAFLPAVLVMSMTAVFLDAIAFTWTDLYGLPAESRIYGAAWILWGLGCIFLFALLDSREKAS